MITSLVTDDSECVCDLLVALQPHDLQANTSKLNDRSKMKIVEIRWFPLTEHSRYEVLRNSRPRQGGLVTARIPLQRYYI